MYMCVCMCVYDWERLAVPVSLCAICHDVACHFVGVFSLGPNVEVLRFDKQVMGFDWWRRFLTPSRLGGGV